MSDDRNGSTSRIAGAPIEAATDLPAGPSRRRRKLVALGALGGAIVGGLLSCGGVLLWPLLSGERLPPLTQSAFDAAVARWQADGPASYDLDVVVEGNRPGRIHVEVRDGQVAAMTRDGASPRQRRTWDAWSVPGMFDTIEIELAAAADPAARFAGQPGSQLVLRAEFDAQYGYPRRYHRVLLQARQEMRWEVVRFVPR